ncbi:NDR1/HIN1-like protein 3 [Rutidosis leptorrhynchoides]|uniref:NDR1/HIN1-like protein 3 n=1 Tax=Rutidosis leptorrhynchoides TaxID=125765 RepID=UPI003A98DA90
MRTAVCFVAICCICISGLIGAYFSVWSKLTSERSHIPKVHVDVALTQFTLSPTNNTLYYNLPANITFQIPTSLVGITFYKTNLYLMYQGQLLGTQRISEAFSLQHKKKKSIVNVTLGGQHELKLNHGDERLVYESDNKSGFYLINVMLRLKMKFKALGLPTKRYAYQIMCDNMEVPLSSEGNVSSVSSVRLDITKCLHKEIDIECFDVEDGNSMSRKYCQRLF